MASPERRQDPIIYQRINDRFSVCISPPYLVGRIELTNQVKNKADLIGVVEGDRGHFLYKAGPERVPFDTDLSDPNDNILSSLEREMKNVFGANYPVVLLLNHLVHYSGWG